ncbi:MAG TPA: sortase [Actinomycetes bacterium]|nr:sortase [Actinomycetes bacterium]
MVGGFVRAMAAGLSAGLLISCDASSPDAGDNEAAPASATMGSDRESPAPSQEKFRDPQPRYSDGSPQRAKLSIPALGLRNLTVVPYVGKTDDARGTRIQNRGLAANPHGPDGGVGPGGIGNYQVTAHRLSSTQAFLNLPELRSGHRAIAVAKGIRYVYEIRDTRRTSFRSDRSLAKQRAAVPGKPGVPARRGYLTLSTCATPEDHARGNFWSDAFGNPEHRIDKIGVLVRSEPVKRS